MNPSKLRLSWIAGRVEGLGYRKLWQGPVVLFFLGGFKCQTFAYLYNYEAVGRSVYQAVVVDCMISRIIMSGAQRQNQQAWTTHGPPCMSTLRSFAFLAIGQSN